MKKLIGEILKFFVSKIELFELFEKYGIDFIVVVQLMNILCKELDYVSSILFFEYQIIDVLVEYLIKIKIEVLMKLIGFDC